MLALGCVRGLSHLEIVVLGVEPLLCYGAAEVWHGGCDGYS